jgi:non-ribosomal peptide synthetase component F
MRSDGTSIVEIDVALTAESTTELLSYARNLDVTLGNVIFAVWSTILAATNDSNDVVFGAAFSGRPAALDDVEEIVGPFVNDLPVRVPVSDYEAVRDLVAGIRDLQFSLTEHQHVPLDDIQAESDVSWRSRLFDSLIVVQNYVTTGLDDAFGGDVRVSDIKGEVRTNYPMTIVVAPGKELKIKFILDAGRMDCDRATDVATTFERLLVAITKRADLTVSEALQLVPEDLSATCGDKQQAKAPDDLRGVSAGMSRVEAALLDVWNREFGIADLGLHNSWADLGIQSALIVRVHARIREKIAPTLSIAKLFEFPSVSRLAAHIASGSQEIDQFKNIASRASRARAASRGRRRARPRKVSDEQ